MTLVRRFLERFALIAFGLYHVPLFLNNYPSLGGGGFNDTGLAVRWGHVFTAPGIWVARQLFHLTGPTSSARNGDNGDVAEEFARLLLAIVIGLIGAAVWTAWDRRRPRAQWVSETTRVLLRYSIALGMTSYAIAKLLPMQFPPLSDLTLEQRLGEMRPMTLLWSFMGYSRPYVFFGGVMEMLVVVLLCFRRTATLGALICVAVVANVAALNFAYDVPVKLYATMIIASAVVLVLYDLPRLTAFFITNRPAAPLAPSFIHQRLGPVARWTIKGLAVGSVIVSSVVAMSAAIGERVTATGGPNGAWLVTSFARSGQQLDSIAHPARWRRFFVAPNSISIRLDSDSLVSCGRSQAGSATMGLTCAHGRLASIHWLRDGNVLWLEGNFDGAPVRISARPLPREEVPLLRGGFRWITDR